MEVADARGHRWTPRHTKFRNVLCELYPDVDSMLRMTDQSGLNRAVINANGPIVNGWHSVVNEALRQGRLSYLIDEVRTDYPDSPELEEAVANITMSHGDRTTTTVLDASEIAWSGTFGSPPSRSNSFIGRNEELMAVHEWLHQDNMQTPRLGVIYGLSGMGKTHLCLEYAAAHEDEYDLVIWTSAQNEALIVAGLSSIARDLGVSAGGHDNQRSAALGLIQYLQKRSKWLVIYDNALPESIRPFLPQSGNGSVLITSNNPNWSSITQNRILLRGLSQDEAVEFFIRRTGTTDREWAARVAASLGFLPLALEQAAAYIEQTSVTLEGYRIF